MMVRKVIQISNSVAQETEDCSEYQIIVALCDDGTMWSIRGRAWQQLPPIPQPEIADCDITFEWQQLPPNHTTINRGDDVVMPKVGDIIFVSNDQRVISGDYTFCGIDGRDVKVSYFQALSYWKLWRYNESDPWRDASGKIV